MNGYRHSAVATPPAAHQYHRTITIDHTKIPNTDQTDFPVLISGTYPFLANLANGGHSSNGSGYDIWISRDSTGSNLMDFELAKYDSTNGEVEIYFRVPNLSHVTDSVYYLIYGASGITTYSGTTATWNSGFKGVQHFKNTSNIIVGLTESTVNTTAWSSATASTMGVSGKTDGGANFTLAETVTASNVPSISTFTISGWLYPIPTSDNYADIFGNGTKGVYYMRATKKMNYFQTSDHLSTTALTDNTWNYFTMVSNGTSIAFYLNGVADGTSSFTVTAFTATQTIGNDAGSESYSGRLDEIRLSNVARSADWIATEYANQNSPSTFYALGLEIF